MLVPAGVRQRLMQDYLPRMLSQPDGIATAWIVPLFEEVIHFARPSLRHHHVHIEPDPAARQVVQTKEELLAVQTKWAACTYQSHKWMRDAAKDWHSATTPLHVNLEWSQEPYYVVNRRSTVRYVGEGSREVNVQRQNEPGALLFVFVLTVVCVSCI